MVNMIQMARLTLERYEKLEVSIYLFAKQIVVTLGTVTCVTKYWYVTVSFYGLSLWHRHAYAETLRVVSLTS